MGRYSFLFLFANLVLFVIVAGLWIAIPEETTLVVSSTLVTLCLAVFWILANRLWLKKYYQSLQFQRFSQELVTILLLVGILGLLNYLAFKNPVSYDVTKFKRYSLTQESMKVLQSLKGELKVTMIGQKEHRAEMAALLEIYRQAYPQITLSFIDAQLRPDLIQSQKIEKVPSLLLELGERKEKVYQVGERGLTNGLVRLARKEAPTLFYVEGFGTPSLEGRAPQDFGRFAELVQSMEFQLKKIEWLSVEKLDPEVKHLMIWGPEKDLRSDDEKKLQAFMQRGGHLFIALDPQFNGDLLKNWRRWLKVWGVVIENTLVIDQVNHISGSKGTAPIPRRMNPKAPQLKDFKGTVFFPLTSSVSAVVGTRPEGVYRELFWTAPYPASWADSNPAEIVSGSLTYREGADTKGPISLGLSVEHTQTKGLIMAFGCSRFLSNSYHSVGHNFHFIRSSMRWFFGEDNLISFDIPEVRREPVFLAKAQLGLIFYGNVILVPLILLALAAWFYQRGKLLA